MFSASRFFLRGSYADGPYETPLAMLMQTLILATGMIGTIALLLMTPRRGTFWTMIGTRSLTDRKSTRLNSSHVAISYAVFCLKKKMIFQQESERKMNTH